MRFVLYLLLCAVLFGAGLGVALFVGVPTAPQEAPIDPTLAASDLSDVVPTDPDAEVILESELPSDELPVPVRGKSLTAEELFRYGAMYREQQQELVRVREELQRKERQLQLMHSDLEGTRKELDGLRVQLRDSASRAERLIASLQEERENLEQSRDSVPSPDSAPVDQTSPAADENPESLRKISAWFQGMPPETAADYLRQLSNDGKMNAAVRLLGNIEERNAAKILAAMDDTSLVVELTEAFRNLKSR